MTPNTYNVRVGLGNGTREQVVQVRSNNTSDAHKAAAAITGGRVLGSSQVPNPKK